MPFWQIITKYILFSDGKILVVGGMGYDTNPKEYIMSFDVEKNLWASLPSMPTARYATFSFLISEKLYVIGKNRLVIRM